MTRDRDKIRIHPTADVSELAEIGQGTSIWHHVQIRERVKIGRDCILGKGVYIDYDVTLGDSCKVQNGVSIYHPAVIADGVFLGPGVIITNDRRPRAVNPDMSLKGQGDWEAVPVTIGPGTAVGAGSILLPGIRIGRWAMIGAGALVTADVPDYGLVVGHPARLVGYVCPCGARLAAGREAGRLICPECAQVIEI